MGNTSSSNKNNNAENEFKNFYDVIDYIATYYILTMDFKSLSKLSEKAYCDKLVILTSDIIERYFNDMEVTYLAQRIKDGVEVNDLKKEKVIFINKDNLESLDISNDAQKSIKKKRVCIGIAKFYVKIAHVFAAIVMTINPVYTYKDATGQTVKTGLLEKDKIPKNVDRKLYKLNICDNRIRALKKGEQIDEKTGNVTLQPRVCDINSNKLGQTNTLADEPGITELMRLYLDDNYDYSNGAFTGMSETTKNQFMKDLKIFYTAFTGNETMPPEITKFSDIKLRDYNKKNGCQGVNPILKNKYSLNTKDKLFIDYAENTKKMIQRAADNQSKLLSIINELFTYVVDPYSGKKVIRVNPKLNEDILQKAVEKTRRMIVDLYVGCETDYVNGVKLYEAIVESKILETTQKQIENLKKEASKIVEETKTISAPVKETIPPAVIIAEPSLPTNTLSSMPTSSTPISTLSMPTSSTPTSSSSQTSTSIPTSSSSQTSTSIPTSSTTPNTPTFLK
jgi:predicted DNA-binding protein